MFKSVSDFFQKQVIEGESKPKKKGKKVQQEEHELQLAAATLMFELVRSDGQTDKIELLYMAEILRKQFSLSDEDIDALFKTAKKTAQDATDLQQFTKAVCNKWGNAKRMKLIENMWIISLADQEIDANERHLVRKIAGLLYLTEMQIVQARENAKKLLNIDDFA